MKMFQVRKEMPEQIDDDWALEPSLIFSTLEDAKTWVLKDYKNECENSTYTVVIGELAWWDEEATDYRPKYYAASNPNAPMVNYRIYETGMEQ